MDSASKRRKKSEDGKLVEEIDRISYLPDPILCHILSLIPTKLAVATTFLSTKWKHLFTSLIIINLDVDDSFLFHHRQGNRKRVDHKSFMDFVDRVLNLCDVSRMNTFHLKCGDCDIACIESWIRFAVLQKVQELDLCVSTKNFTKLPREFFTCETLVVLKLMGTFDLDFPEKVGLLNLKRLHLTKIQFIGNKSIRELLSSCPVLEDLAILGCRWDYISTLTIFAPALKYLTINCLLDYGYSTQYCKYEIVIDAPKLVYLKYIDYVPCNFSGKNLHSLAEAHIDVGLSSHQEHAESHFHYTEPAFTILKEISEVKSLHLTNRYMEAIGLHRWSGTMFSRLIHLELGVNHRVGWQTLYLLLESSPVLETLIFVEGLLDREHEHETKWMVHKNVPPSAFLYVVSPQDNYNKILSRENTRAEYGKVFSKERQSFEVFDTAYLSCGGGRKKVVEYQDENIVATKGLNNVSIGDLLISLSTLCLAFCLPSSSL